MEVLASILIHYTSSTLSAYFLGRLVAPPSGSLRSVRSVYARSVVTYVDYVHVRLPVVILYACIYLHYKYRPG